MERTDQGKNNTEMLFLRYFKYANKKATYLADMYPATDKKKVHVPFCFLT